MSVGGKAIAVMFSVPASLTKLISEGWQESILVQKQSRGQKNSDS